MKERKLLEAEEKRIISLLKDEMKKQGITDYKLSQDTKISRNTFANAVKGVSHPTLLTILCVAKYLGMDMKDVFDNL